jgi:hypothetical protein
VRLCPLCLVVVVICLVVVPLLGCGVPKRETGDLLRRRMVSLDWSLVATGAVVLLIAENSQWGARIPECNPNPLWAPNNKQHHHQGLTVSP